MSKLREESRSVLEGFFSAPIAKAIVGAATKVAGRAGAEDGGPWQHALQQEIARLLCVYLPDLERRRACVAQLATKAAVAQPTTHEVGHARPASGSYLRPRVGEIRTASSVSVRPATLGTASTSVVVRDQSDIPNACEVVRDLGKKLGFSRVDQTKMATAVSELARNMLQYAGGGTIRFAEVLAPRRGLEAFFEDHGPGIIGLDDMLEAGSMGLGLRGSKGIADEFLIDTQPGDGTRITMRKYVA